MDSIGIRYSDNTDLVRRYGVSGCHHNISIGVVKKVKNARVYRKPVCVTAFLYLLLRQNHM